MKKWIIIILMAIMSVNLVYGLEECTPVIDTLDAQNCTITTTWEYPNLCAGYQAHIYLVNGSYIQSLNLTTIPNTAFCVFYWNVTEKGSYFYNITSGDTGTITVGADKLVQNIILGIGIITFIFFFLAYKLDQEHFLLKLLLIISGISMLILIPSNILTDGAGLVTFYRLFMYIYVAFWIYIFIYLVYRVFKYFNVVVKGKE